MTPLLIKTYVEKKNTLNDSPLWKSLLSDKEIRYSDFIGLFIETYKVNPFDCEQINETYNIEVNREKKHTDLWIEKILDISKDVNIETLPIRANEQDEIGIIRIPWILIENKLKSIPFEEQLRRYTEKFVDEYIIQIKKLFKSKHTEFQPSKKNKRGKQINLSAIREKNDEQISNLLNEIQHLKFYVISPFKNDDLKTTFKLSRQIIPYNNGILEFTWEQISYPELGNNMLKILENDNNHAVKKYLKELFRDFAEILDSMTLFNSALMNLDFTAKIIDFFNPSGKPGFKDFKNMHSLYAKVKASQCAHELKRRIKKVDVSNKSVLKMHVEEVLTHFDFSRKDSLFEVKKCIIENKLMIIIQYQNKELRKGLVVADKTIGNYNLWFDQQWNGIEFSQKPNDGYYSYRINDEMTFFYYKHECENESVDTILELMAEKIQDNAEETTLTNCYNLAIC